jgi:hypothetical protein
VTILARGVMRGRARTIREKRIIRPINAASLGGISDGHFG